MTAHDIARLLPAVPDLRDRLRAMAMLEAILSPEWADRYHSYDRAWSHGVEVATMRTGSGDEFSVVFEDGTAYIRGFAHESPMSPYTADGPWPGVLDYGEPLDPAAVRHVYALRPLTGAVVAALNVDVTPRRPGRGRRDRGLAAGALTRAARRGRTSGECLT